MAQTNWVYTDTVLEHFMHPKNILEDEKSYKEDGDEYLKNAIYAGKLSAINTSAGAYVWR
jgi:hypothetical protein